MLLVIALFIFLMLVVLHEAGHFITARRNGIVVEEFGIGMPIPLEFNGKALRLKYFTDKHGTEYTIHPIPAGAFVSLKGESDADDEPGTFGAASFWVKTKVILAGVLINFLLTIGLMMYLAKTSMPMIIDGQYRIPDAEERVRTQVIVRGIAEDSAAAGIGLDSGDIIQTIDGETFSTLEEIQSFTGARPGQTVDLRYLDGGVEKQASVELGSSELLDVDGNIVLNAAGQAEIVGRLGIDPFPVEFVRYPDTIDALKVSLGGSVQIVRLTLGALGSLFKNVATDGLQGAEDSGVAGPFGMIDILKSLGSIELVLVIMANISAALFVFNALPIPATDGGRFALIALYKIMGRPLTTERETQINYAGFMFLMALFAMIMVVDVRRYFF